MKIALTAFSIILLWGINLGASDEPLDPAPPTVTKAKTPMHPPVEPLNGIRQNALYTETPIDANTTCGNCHDTAFIRSHSTHGKQENSISCFDCHVPNMSQWTRDQLNIYGKLDAARTGIQRASTQVCASCHGVVAQHSLVVPDDYETTVVTESGNFTYDMTRFTGTFYSGESFSDSQLNLANKSALTFPADVHAKRMLGCMDCHHSTNNPAKSNLKNNSQPHLKRDPRTTSFSAYLQRPNHILNTPRCTDCHSPEVTHNFLPYKERHLAVLDCQSCHVPKVYGPMISVIDETVITSQGVPFVEYAESSKRGGPINARLISGVEPALLPYVSSEGTPKVGAFNFVVKWFWEDGSTGKKIPTQTLQQLFTKNGKGHSDKAIQLFDKNDSGKIENNELLIETETQRKAVAEWLKGQGFANARIVGTVDAHSVSHGITESHGVTSTCQSCHEESGRLSGDISISKRLPFGARAGNGNTLSALSHGKLENQSSIKWIRNSSSSSYYVFGHSRTSWSDLIGLLAFGGAFLGVFIHGGYRLYSRKKRTKVHSDTTRVYMYSLYERIWHWLMASSVVALLITGLKIHFPSSLPFIAFPTAIAVHNATAVILVVNAGLSLFFHIATAAITKFIPEKDGLLQALLNQVEYYTRGIFLGNRHPTEKTPDKKLNPLQQLTYLGLLNVLFPLQVITGVAIWMNAKWPQLLEPLGGLTIVGPVHNLGSWLFLTFLAVHIYLTTTGHTVFSNISAMIDGYDEIDAGAIQGEKK